MIESTGIAGKRRHDTPWPTGPSQPESPANRTDIWRVCLDQPSGEDSETSVLSGEEIERANRFLFERDRIRFTRCRSALRGLLARYLAIPAPALRFDYLPQGKPQVAADQNPAGLQFNLSHSANLALIAVADGYQLGVDVEKIRSEVDTAALAERFFSLHERASLRALPDHLRVSGFFACWTRKEAFLKATGDGLSFPLGDFSVTTHPELDPALVEIRGNRETGKQWFLADIEVRDGYRAAVAVDHAFSDMKTYAWK